MLQPIGAIKAQGLEIAGPLVEGKATVGHQYVQKFAYAQPVSEVFLQNKTDAAWSPKMEINLFNRYGLWLGSAEITRFQSILPGEVIRCDLQFKGLGNLPYTFQRASATLPRDFNTPAFVAFSFEAKK